MTANVLRYPLVRWPGLFLVWTLVGLSFAAQFYLASTHSGLEITWRQALGGALGDWYAIALLTVPSLWLARRFPLGRENWGRRLALHALAAVAFSGAFILLRAGLAQWQGWAAGRELAFADAARTLLLRTWHFNLFIYGVILAVTHAVSYYRESQERARRALELERRLAEARLMALQMQLNPHFLFNALNAIATLMHRDVETADRMLVRLAELLRLTLDQTGVQEVPLRQELALLERYLDLERIRFGERLEVNVSVAPDVLEAAVPTLLLQPLVENSLRHGLTGAAARRGLIAIAARREESCLVLEVRDNGRGLAGDAPARDGIGLANTRARLEQLHGAAHQFDLVNHPEGGCLARIRVPLRPAAARRSTSA